MHQLLKKNSFPISALAVSLLFQASALYFTILEIGITHSLKDKMIQVSLFLGFSFFLSFFYLAKKNAILIIIQVIKTIALLFTSQAVGTKENIYLLATLSLLIEVIFFIKEKWNIFVALFLLSIELYVLQPHYMHDDFIPGITKNESFLLSLFSLSLILLSQILKKYKKSYVQDEKEIARLNTVITNITDTNLEYQNYAQSLEKRTLEHERQRISREIHDIIGYSMTNVLMLIQAARHSKDKEQADSLLEKAQSHVSKSVDEARLALRRMREQHIPQKRGLHLFLQLTKTFSSISGISISIDFANMPQTFNPIAEKAIFRMLEEGMTNSFKHGKATHIEISFALVNDTIILRMRDNGKNEFSFDKKITEGIGIKGMKERLSFIGGTVCARYVIDGFLLEATIPLEIDNE